MKKIITTLFILLWLTSCSSTASESYTEESFVGSWKTSNIIDLGELILNVNTIKEYEKDGNYIAESILKFSNLNDILVAEYSMIGKAKWKISNNELIEYSKTIDSFTKKSSNHPIIQLVLANLKEEINKDGIRVIYKIIHIDKNTIITRDVEGKNSTITRVK